MPFIFQYKSTATEYANDDAVQEKYRVGDSGSLNNNHCDPIPRSPRRSR